MPVDVSTPNSISNKDLLLATLKPSKCTIKKSIRNKRLYNSSVVHKAKSQCKDQAIATRTVAKTILSASNTIRKDF